MQEHYVTITGFQHYYGLNPFAVGSLVRCTKEPDNRHDREAIRCSLPRVGTVGYIANSPGTRAGGTMSAGRIYDHVPRRFWVRVMFTTGSKVICRVEEPLTNDPEFLWMSRMEEEDLPCGREREMPLPNGEDLSF